MNPSILMDVILFIFPTEVIQPFLPYLQEFQTKQDLDRAHGILSDCVSSCGHSVMTER